MKIALTVGLVAITLFSLGLPAFATTGQSGPATPKVGDPVTTRAEVQVLRMIGDPTTGNYRLQFQGTTIATTDIAYNASATGNNSIESRVEAMTGATLDVVDVSISYGSSQGAALRGRSFTITFNSVTVGVGGAAVWDVPPLEVIAPSPGAALAGPRPVFGVLHSDIGAGDTSFDVDEIVAPPTGSGLLVDTEQMTFTSKAGGPGQFTYTVARGAGGTTAAAHLADAVVYSSSAVPFATVATAVNGLAPVTGQTSPHGGYSSVTDYCLQCHAVHAVQVGGNTVVPGPFALQVAGSVTDTCSTCHSLFNNGASIGSLSPINSDAITGKPTIPGGMATASLRSAYDLGDGRYLTAADPVAGHEIGAPTSPDGTVIEGEIGGASATQGGLYCGSCHTPHGDFGKLVNSVYYRSEASNCTGVSATTAPCAGAKTNEIQTLTISDTTITPAKFRITFSGQTTPVAGIAFNATASTIQSALAGLSNIGSTTTTTGGSVANVVVSTMEPPGVNQAEFEIQFIGGTVKGANVAQMTTDSGSAVVATKTEGGLTDTSTTTYVTPWNTLAPFTNNAIFYEGRTQTWYLWFDTNSGIWLKCDAVDGGGSCAAISSADYLTTVDMEGQTVYLYGYKLLTRFPNGTEFPQSFGFGRGGHDGALWCGTCHPAQTGEEVGGEHPSHPGTCTYCHGNPADGSSFDFPHTSTNGSLLKEYPDALCVVCHAKGSLP